MRTRPTIAVTAVLVLMLMAGGSGSVRADVPPPPPRPPQKPTLAGVEVPRPLHVIVAGAAIAAAIASAGVWFFRGSGRLRRVGRSGGIVAAAAIVSATGLLAYGSHSVLRHYQAEKDRIDEEYRIRRQNWRPLGPVRRREQPVVPAPSTPAPTPRPS